MIVWTLDEYLSRGLSAQVIFYWKGREVQIRNFGPLKSPEVTIRYWNGKEYVDVTVLKSEIECFPI